MANNCPTLTASKNPRLLPFTLFQAVKSSQIVYVSNARGDTYSARSMVSIESYSVSPTEGVSKTYRDYR